MSAAFPHDPAEHVVDRLWRDDDVEGRRHRATLLEVAHPELAPRELPLGVGTLLSTRPERQSSVGGNRAMSDNISLDADASGV